MKRTYLIDSENINDVWVELLQCLEEDDGILVFFTDKSAHMGYDRIIRIMQQEKGTLQWIRCFEGQNALDFQLVTEMGHQLYMDPEREYVIVSNDTGYDAAVRYWQQKGSSVSRMRGVEIERLVSETKRKAQQKRNGRRNAQAAEAKAAEAKAAETKVPEAKAAETKAAEVNVSEAKAAEAKPAEGNAAEGKPTERKAEEKTVTMEPKAAKKAAAVEPKAVRAGQKVAAMNAEAAAEIEKVLPQPQEEKQSQEEKQPEKKKRRKDPKRKQERKAAEEPEQGPEMSQADGTTTVLEPLERYWPGEKQGRKLDVQMGTLGTDHWDVAAQAHNGLELELFYDQAGGVQGEPAEKTESEPAGGLTSAAESASFDEEDMDAVPSAEETECDFDEDEPDEPDETAEPLGCKEALLAIFEETGSHTPRRDLKFLKGICRCVRLSDMSELHNILEYQFGQETGNAIYHYMKKNPACRDDLAAGYLTSKKQRERQYLDLILGRTLGDQKDTEAIWKILTAIPRRNLSSIHAALVKKFGQEKGANYYAVLRNHVKIIRGL